MSHAGRHGGAGRRDAVRQAAVLVKWHPADTLGA